MGDSNLTISKATSYPSGEVVEDLIFGGTNAQILKCDTTTPVTYLFVNNPVGPQGTTGPTGPTGPQGEQGNQGVIGPVGPVGAQGQVGNKGATGEVGDKGGFMPSVSVTVAAAISFIDNNTKFRIGLGVGTPSTIAFYNSIIVGGVITGAPGTGSLPSGPNIVTRKYTDDVFGVLYYIEGTISGTGGVFGALSSVTQAAYYLPGPTGPVGDNGLAGPVGDKGPISTTAGPAGDKGAAGNKGATGNKGNTGNAGAAGISAPVGPRPFSNSTVRNTTITAPTNGLFTFLLDTEKLQVNINGSWRNYPVINRPQNILTFLDPYTIQPSPNVTYTVRYQNASYQTVNFPVLNGYTIYVISQSPSNGTYVNLTGPTANASLNAKVILAGGGGKSGLDGVTAVGYAVGGGGGGGGVKTLDTYLIASPNLTEYVTNQYIVADDTPRISIANGSYYTMTKGGDGAEISAPSYPMGSPGACGGGGAWYINGVTTSGGQSYVGYAAAPGTIPDPYYAGGGGGGMGSEAYKSSGGGAISLNSFMPSLDLYFGAGGYANISETRNQCDFGRGANVAASSYNRVRFRQGGCVIIRIPSYS